MSSNSSISGLVPIPWLTCFPATWTGVRAGGGGEASGGGGGPEGASSKIVRLTLQVLTGKCQRAKEEKSQGPPKFLRLHAARPAHYPWQTGSWEGKRLGRRREQERGAEGRRGESKGGQKAGEGGLKQRAANHSGGIPSAGGGGEPRAPESPRGLLAASPSLLVLSPGALLSLIPSRCWGPQHRATEGYCFLEGRVRGRQEPLAWAVAGSGHYFTAGRNRCQGRGRKELVYSVQRMPTQHEDRSWL